ncbi:MAG TPA: hypothetical protein DEQ20_04880 [Desulfobulbaceae bacterium]|nr:hypothetical protein [Desulfobulbaceae bacterium]
MVRTLKSRLNVYIDPETHERVIEYSQKTGISVSHLVNSILSSMFNAKTEELSFLDFSNEYVDKLISGLTPQKKLSHEQPIDIEVFKEEIKKQILEELKKNL